MSAEIESWYSKPDPWAYKTTHDDLYRRTRILMALFPYQPFNRALDIGCGEGFITEMLPATTLHGIELSTKAAERLPASVRRVHEPDGQYDLVTATGVLYAQYDWQQFTDWIMTAATRIVLTCHIQDWEVNHIVGNEVYQETFPYRGVYTQVLRVYEW